MMALSPRSREQNEHIKDERREQILCAALRVFAHKGLAASKVGDIAAAAGLSHGLVYHYFESKDAIFTELVRRAVDGSTGLLLQAEGLPMEPVEKIRFITASTLGGIGACGETAYYFFLMAQAFATEAVPGEVKGLLNESYAPLAVMARIVAEGQAKGQVREGDPQGYATAYWAAVQGLATYKVAMGDRFSMPDGDLLVRMFEK